MNIVLTSGLKGQKILAQGKRSVALGLEAEKKNVRAESFLKTGTIFRTKGIIPSSRTNVLHLSVRTGTFSLNNLGSRTANSNVSAIPGRRSYLTCPGLNHTGPSGRKNGFEIESYFMLNAKSACRGERHFRQENNE